MSEDTARRLAEALIEYHEAYRKAAPVIARVLLPVVRELCDLRAAEELEAAGDAHPCTRGRLHERAAALRGEAGR